MLKCPNIKFPSQRQDLTSLNFPTLYGARLITIPKATASVQQIATGHSWKLRIEARGNASQSPDQAKNLPLNRKIVHWLRGRLYSWPNVQERQSFLSILNLISASRGHTPARMPLQPAYAPSFPALN